jgi:hypothetical protein
MVDPISTFSPHPSNQHEFDLIHLRPKTPAGQPVKSDPRLNMNRPATQDSVQINFNLSGNLQALQGSVKSLYETIKTQLEQYYDITQQDADAGNQIFLPPEEASGQDLLEYLSPQNTADRIVRFATGFYDQFLLNNPDGTDEENIEAFTTLITDAIKKGFEEANTILGDLSAFEEIGQNIQTTYQMVLEGIHEFRMEFLKRASVDVIDPEAQPDPIEELTDEFVQKNTLLEGLDPTDD